MDLIIAKVESSVELINVISGYYEEFHKLLNNKKIAEELDDEIKNTVHVSRDKLLKRLGALESKAVKELNFNETTTLVFQTYQLIREYETLIDKIANQITEWNVFVRPDIITSNVAQTKLSDLSKKSNAIGLLMNNFKRKYEEFDVDSLKTFTEFIINILNINETKVEDVIFLQETFRKYPLTIDIYAILLQTIMDLNRDLITPILNIIEQDKTFILGNYKSKYTKETYNISSVQNPSYRYFGLVPADVCKSLEELFPDYSPDTPEKMFETISKKEAITIIYIKKFTAHPLEFSIWKLTRIEDASKYIQGNGNSGNGGLTKLAIERMKVINYIEEPEKNQKWKLSEYLTFGDVKNSNYFYILDSFNGKTFRFIRPWADRLNKIPRSYINGLLSYMGLIPANKKDRISTYNEIQEEEIYKHMFLRQPIDIEELIADVQADMDAPKLKQELVTLLSASIKPSRNWVELGSAVHNPEFMDSFADNLVKLYPVFFKDSIATDKRVQFPFSETLSTFLVELNNVKRSFGRALHEKYVKTPRDTQFTAFKSADNAHYFINQLIKNALDEVITNKSNVYSSLLMKNKILTIELNESDIEKTIMGGFHSEEYGEH